MSMRLLWLAVVGAEEKTAAVVANVPLERGVAPPSGHRGQQVMVQVATPLQLVHVTF